MILIDALYINDGGGKILLDYLIQILEKNNIKVLYLLDKRVKYNHPQIKENKVIYLKASFLLRNNFYLKNRNTFTKVFCFGNLPPNIKMDSIVYTYFQQVIYLEIPREFSLKEKIKFLLKTIVLKRLIKNSDFWLVQSNIIKAKLQTCFPIKSDKVLILPFYPEFNELKNNINREKQTYLYVSNATPHKNHLRLIDNFCNFYDLYKIGKLTLTVNQNYPDIYNYILNKKKQGYPIYNIGFVNREQLYTTYLSSEFLIFPSLAESFGLGLIEAIECGCKIIGADLPYTYEVCEPSIVFNPLNDESIFKAFENSLDTNIKASVPKIKNNIDKLVTLLK